MAAVAGGALVGVAGDAAVVLVHLGPIRVLVAEDALEDLVVACRDMAVGAARPAAAVLAGVDGEVAAVVVPAGGAPRARRVARLAIARERRGLVVGIRGALVVVLVTGVARCGSSR